MSTTTKETTEVNIVDADINALLGDASNVMVPAGKEEPKPSLFSRNQPDLSFLNDKKDDKVDKTDDPNNPPATPVAVAASEVNNILDIQPLGDDNIDDPDKKAGRKPVSKEGLVELTNKLIEKKMLVPFDDEKPIEQYTLQDFEELFEANEQERTKKIQAEITNNFLQSLPEEFSFAYKYLEDGGQDLKGLFRTLAAVEEVRQMDPSKEGDSKNIVRSYLQATRFGTPEEIEEEINAWDDRGELESKAKKFKPKLDAMTEQQVAYKLQQQEQMRKQQEAQANQYTDSIYQTLEPAELNGLKLDRKTQNLLFTGLTQVNYPSVSGRQTNLLGHLLEKHQYLEPNHSLIAEALWLLADPDGYKTKVRELTKKDVVEDTVRKLKTEERNKIPSAIVNQDDQGRDDRGPKIARPNKSFFKR